MNNATTIHADKFVADLIARIAPQFIAGTATTDSCLTEGTGGTGEFTVYAVRQNADGIGRKTVKVMSRVDAATAVAMKRAINYPA